MALQSTLYRFRIELSDIDRNVYESIDLRLAMHPSESPVYLITRLLAYLLNYQTGLEFSPQGLGDPDPPAISIPDPRGGVLLWLEIGNPSAKRLHSATKAASKVKVYTYKDAKQWLLEMQSANIFHFDQVEIFSFENDFLQKAAAKLERNNDWSLIQNDCNLTLNFKNESIESPILQLANQPPK
jgi:uncharacterized protein YaeQ